MPANIGISMDRARSGVVWELRRGAIEATMLHNISTIYNGERTYVYIVLDFNWKNRGQKFRICLHPIETLLQKKPKRRKSKWMEKIAENMCKINDEVVHPLNNAHTHLARKRVPHARIHLASFFT